MLIFHHYKNKASKRTILVTNFQVNNLGILTSQLPAQFIKVVQVARGLNLIKRCLWCGWNFNLLWYSLGDILGLKPSSCTCFYLWWQFLFTLISLQNVNFLKCLFFFSLAGLKTLAEKVWDCCWMFWNDWLRRKSKDLI